MKLEGRTVLVSGASRGIGHAIALGCAAAGAHVVGMARTASALERLGEEVSKRGVDYLAAPTDLSDVEALRAGAAEAWDWRGGIDVLVNAAGMIVRGAPLDMEPDSWDEVFALNV